MKHTSLDPADLKPHPILNDLPAHKADGAAYDALCDDVLERGQLRDPIKISSAHRIVDLDSLDRWRAAKQCQLTKVPCIEVADDDIAGAAVLSLVHRRHYTKSQLAYVLYPALKAAHEELRARHLERLRAGGQTKVHAVNFCPFPNEIDDLAEKIGIGKTLFSYAARVHETFAKDPRKYEFKVGGMLQELTLRDYFEPRILQPVTGGEHQPAIGLGAVLAGIGGLDKTAGKARQDHRPEQLLLTGFQSVVVRLGKLDAARIRPVVREVVMASDAGELDKLEAFAEELTSEIKARRKVLTKGAGL